MAETYYSVEYLTSKIQNWTLDSSLTFHTSEQKAYPEKSKYIWETANTDQYEGFVHYGPNFASYYSAIGDEYVLTSTFWNTQFSIDWEANKALYKRSLTATNGFKTLNPIGFNEGYNMGSYEKTGIYKEIDIDGKKFVYFKLKHPNLILGSNHTFSIPIEERVQFFVDNLTILLSNITAVLKEDSSIKGYPSIKYSWLCTSNGSPYWRFLYQWNLDAETLYSKIVGELQKYIQNLEKNGYIVPAEIETKAREEWKTILNI